MSGGGGAAGGGGGGGGVCLGYSRGLVANTACEIRALFGSRLRVRLFVLS